MRFFGILVCLLLLLGLAEVFCRVVVGLGDPPLSQSDRQIEYLFKPSQTCHRFHRLVHINQYSMRSDDFPSHKSDPSELRVMVIGDSVVYDGVQIDQRDICTEVMKRKLAKDLARKVTVGNIAAKSWGPPNELEYVKRFGLFDADYVLLVLSSHDYADVPTFAPVVDVDPDYPGHRPVFALSELFIRYLPRYLPASWRPRINPDEPQNPTHKDIEWALSSERELIALAKNGGATIALAQMLEKDELDGHFKVGHRMIFDVAEQERIPILELGDLFQDTVHHGQNPYLDHIHPNILGCKIMGESMAASIEKLLTGSSQLANGLSRQ
jgi:hypothetical protein